MSHICLRSTACVAFAVWACLSEQPATAQSSFDFEARSAAITAPFVLSNDCISQSLATDLADGGRAVFALTLTNAGTYALICSVSAPAGATNSLYVDIDNEPQGPKAIWDIPATSGFENRIVFWPENAIPGIAQPRQKNFTLSPGTHEIILRGKSADVRLARVSLKALPAPPSNLRVLSSR